MFDMGNPEWTMKRFDEIISRLDKLVNDLKQLPEDKKALVSRTILRNSYQARLRERAEKAEGEINRLNLVVARLKEVEYENQVLTEKLRKVETENEIRRRIAIQELRKEAGHV